MFTDFTVKETDAVMQAAWSAFEIYKKRSLVQRADFIRSIATEISALGDTALHVASKESHLPLARLQSELTRTIFQLNSYAAFCESGQWLDVRIDKADTARNPPKPGLRKMLVPLGPVVVFGASNFPFAYSTAGGDTASAFAAGCPVIVKAHPAHAETSEMIAGAIRKAVRNCDLPEGVFAHVHGAASAVGEALVKHPYCKAVGFTGSFAGGKQLFDWGNQREEPIPVFAEMGSVNPVFMLPGRLKLFGNETAKMLASSIVLSAGQFCTNPGIMIAIANEDLDAFIQSLKQELAGATPAAMLNSGIYQHYTENRERALGQQDVDILLNNTNNPLTELSVLPTIAATSARAFLQNPLLQEEVFGPYSLLVRCTDVDEMMQVSTFLKGQLTCSLMATDEEIVQCASLVESLQRICGRFIFNGVPTGVEVALAMQHGGPFPATTDSRFTSVGADAIKRFARPLSFQNWPDHLLPPELQDQNPLGIWRTVDNTLTK